MKHFIFKEKAKEMRIEYIITSEREYYNSYHGKRQTNYKALDTTLNRKSRVRVLSMEKILLGALRTVNVAGRNANLVGVHTLTE